eukprot:CAMPEP_0119316294 /NCGR_PEP_ID=MMETSP1333-20130426/39315_1 /TAXON_ID=418940 /ORGANISM="Scyphosphaera apsteinii, Strain RCC1455" /LENGTH=743 /DNA_ID=CAMNT_0007321899 /DNA_START=37 /DNA_END=2268 /DNA_ORIENTATION=+
MRKWLLRGAAAGGVGGLAYQFMPVSSKDFGGIEKKKGITRYNSLLDRGQDVKSMPSRDDQVKALKSGEPFDMVIVGGGCTGAGAALDAVTRGLKVACIERGDFSNETSSRSSKLIWGGFKYLQVAFAELLSQNTLSVPISSLQKFWGEFNMVWECCQERSWLAGFQPHLVEYVPQAVPFNVWFQWPPFFDHPFYSILPVLAVPAFWFYDALAGFHGPMSYWMGPAKTKEVFPQLSDVKYSAVYAEAMHNDARTGTAIALTAAYKGAQICNYIEMTGFVYGGPEGATCTGIRCVDKVTNEEFEIKATAVVLATGAFLDGIRRMEDPNVQPSVRAAAGCHIILPGYFTPGGMGFANLRTSRGATMYFLPWLGHTVVGSTDKKCDATSSPKVSEDEIQYLVNEAASCLSPDIRVRRSDVMSAWQGWRPLYRDPNAPPDAPVSRHHSIGIDPTTGVTFICGGKWSTYRAMAEELVDKVVDFKKLPAGPCSTKTIKLMGGDGWHPLLYVQLIQKYGVSEEIAKHLVHTYGTGAFAVCEMARPTGKRWPRFGRIVAEGHPYIEAEVDYACKYEYVVTVKDMLTLRMRLAYLNSEAAKEAIPRIADLMAQNLGWSKKEKAKQIELAQEYIGDFGGPVANKEGAQLRAATYTDLVEAFTAVDTDSNGYINEQELNHAAIKLGFPFRNKNDLAKAVKVMDTNNNGKISQGEFVEWWNRKDEFSRKLHQTLSLTAANEVAIDKLLADEKPTSK